jgi:hypothetical protein
MRQKPIIVLVGLLLAACGTRAPNLVPAQPKPAAAHAARAPAHVRAEPARANDVPPVAFSHAVGDYIVRRFSLRSRAAPTVLTERVVAVKEASIVLEVTRETGAETRSLRVELGSEQANLGRFSRLRCRDGRRSPWGARPTMRS